MITIQAMIHCSECEKVERTNLTLRGGGELDISRVPTTLQVVDIEAVDEHGWVVGEYMTTCPACNDAERRRRERNRRNCL